VTRILSNLHTHTAFSDGDETAEEFVLAAIDKGFQSLGFSEHGFAEYDADCCIKSADIPAYLAEIQRLRGKYAGKIELYTGFEYDYFAPVSREGLDFTIGSVHYVRTQDGAYHCIDYLPRLLETAALEMGGVQALVEQYFNLVMDMALRQKPDILGHLDLITKFNANGRCFDTRSAWYQALIDRTVEVVARSGCVVEVNTGGLYNGYTSKPYPRMEWIRRLYLLGVPVTISSDAHCTDALDYLFEEMVSVLLEVGYTSIVQMVGGRLEQVPLER